MCGRTACTLAPDEFPRACKFKGKNGKTQEPQWKDCTSGGKYYPSHNISPQSYTPVLLSSQHFCGTLEEGAVSERVLQPMKWGLIPSWYRGDPKEFGYNMSNARSDTLLDKKSFKSPLEKGKRCVVLAEGFFEWQGRQKGEKKQPYYIYFKKDRKMSVAAEEDKKSNLEEEKDVKPKAKEEAKPLSVGEPVKVKSEDTSVSVHEETTVKREEASPSGGDKCILTMAGLFDCWQAPKGSSNEGEELYTYTIITVDSSPSLRWLHDRMPAILDGEEEIRQWLDFGEVPWEKALDLVNPKECLEWHPVSTIVNNSRNKQPECIQPIDLTKKAEKPVAGTLLSYFKPSPKKRDNKSTGDELSDEPSPKKTKFQ